MSEHSSIEWTDATFNPWIGCTKVSAGCTNCYAEAQNNYRKWNGGTWGPGAPRKMTSAAYWRAPYWWDAKAEREGKQRRVFCASLADVFDPAVPDAWRDRLFSLIELTPHLDWLLLTKRPENARRYLGAFGGDAERRIWLGVSVEDQATADQRIPQLLACSTAVHFISYEPALGPLDAMKYMLPSKINSCPQAFTPELAQLVRAAAKSLGTHFIDWVIAGGESQRNARPTHPDWFRSIREQCRFAGVPFFFKQWGEWRPAGQGEEYAMPRGPAHIWPDASEVSFLVGKKAAGRMLDGRMHDEFPGAA